MRTRARWERLLLLPVALAAVVAGRVVATWMARRSYHFDLEWMEGGVLAHAWRVLHLEPLYVAPGPDFVPMVYTPGYYYVLALLGTITDLSHPLGRTVSALATLAAAAAIAALGRRQAESLLAGLVGAGVYLGCYELSGAFYDLVRPDALAVGLLAWAVVLSAEAEARTRAVGAVLLAAAFVVKHNMAAFGLPLALGIWAWRGLRPALGWAALAAVPALAWTVAMQVGSEGRFLAYVLQVPASHPLQLARAWPGLPRETGHGLPVVAAAATLLLPVFTARAVPGSSLRSLAALSAVAGLATVGLVAWSADVQGLFRHTPVEAATGAALAGVGGCSLLVGLVALLRGRRPEGPWVMAAGIGLVAAVVAGLMRAHHGGFLNVHMPWHWVLSAGFALTLAELVRQRQALAGALVATLLALGQLGLQLGAQDLDRLVPTEADEQAGQDLVSRLAGHAGPVLSPFAPWLAAQAGHRPGYHLIALWDIRHKGGPFYGEAHRVLDAIRTRHYGTVIDARQSMGLGVRRAYEVAEDIVLPPRVLLPRTGWPRRPSVLLVRPARPEPGPTPPDAADDDTGTPPSQEQP
ncbi:MAG: hypothetical protein H6732_11585 [Alphaproteobacteria bacterium]|nr:hypothetical protein [Alphaproteobacteria bacterium]